jgi:hypothetical protein
MYHLDDFLFYGSIYRTVTLLEAFNIITHFPEENELIPLNYLLLFFTPPYSVPTPYIFVNLVLVLSFSSSSSSPITLSFLILHLLSYLGYLTALSVPRLRTLKRNFIDK